MNDWIEIDANPSPSILAKWLLIDESAFILSQFREVLKSVPLQLIEARDLVSAVEVINSHSDIEIIICDINLLRMNGATLFDSLAQQSQPSTPLYLLSAENKVDLVADAHKFGAAGWVCKPPILKDLSALFEKARTR
jgi:DNA-binding NtrC family response regulator